MRYCKHEHDFKRPDDEVSFHFFNANYGDLHYHNYWEVFLILDGTLLHNINNHSMIIQKGDLFIIRPKDAHVFLRYRNFSSQHINLMITDTALYSMLNTIDPSLYMQLLCHPNYIRTTLTPAQYERMSTLIDSLYKPTELPIASVIKFLILEAISDCYMNGSIRNESFTVNSMPEWLTQLLNRMHSPNNMGLSFHELCAPVNFSQVHINRMFKQYMNETIGNYFQSVKMEYAAKLLETTDFSVLEISSRIGYSSLSHFIHVFKEKFNCSPKEYRRVSNPQGKQKQPLPTSKKNEAATRFGTNYYSLFSCTFTAENEYDFQPAERGLAVLAEHNIHVVRFNASGFYYPNDMRRYFADKNAYFDALHKLTHLAEMYDIRLIPSFFWQMTCLPNLFDEGYETGWGNQKSNTFRFMTNFTKEYVSALAKEKNIAFWEFGNEFNLVADLPNFEQNLKTDPLPAGSARSARSAQEDKLTTSGVNGAFAEFARIVKQEDALARPSGNGNAFLRPSQYNQYAHNTFTHDTLDEHAAVWKLLCPAPMTCASEHIYHPDWEKPVMYGNRAVSLEEYLRFNKQLCDKNGYTYYIGEYGAIQKKDPSDYSGWAEMSELFRKCGIPLALVWNYDPDEIIEYSFSEKSAEGKYILRTLKELNKEEP